MERLRRFELSPRSGELTLARPFKAGKSALANTRRVTDA